MGKRPSGRGRGDEGPRTRGQERRAKDEGLMTGAQGQGADWGRTRNEKGQGAEDKGPGTRGQGQGDDGPRTTGQGQRTKDEGPRVTGGLAEEGSS